MIKYFQIAPCFRDEDARGDRSPGEFYQLDMEMAFASQEDVFAVLEDVLPPIFAKYGTYDIASQPPFRRIPYMEAMDKYGSDKPDLRIDLTVTDISAMVQDTGFEPFVGQVVKAVPVSGCTLTRKQIDKLCADVEVRRAASPTGCAWTSTALLSAAWRSSSRAKRMRSGKHSLSRPIRLCSSPPARRPRRRKPPALCSKWRARSSPATWTRSATSSAGSSISRCLRSARSPASLSSATTVLDAERRSRVLLAAERGELDPLTIMAYQYDLVCNGVELSSGAVRNHDPDIMVKAFEMVRLGEDDVKAKFPAMYNAFCYGAPPHAGIAPGVDRMVMLLAGESSIREIIPFPMNKNAQDVMMGAPSTVEQKQLDELHIALVGQLEE